MAWGENIGWTNWRGAGEPDGSQAVSVGLSFLSGFLWAENVGWVNVGDGTPGADCAGAPCYANLDGTDSGVNIDPTSGELSGYAWGENIGWINFDTAGLGTDQALCDACTHQFFGYAWGENVGWINLADATHFVAVGPCAFGDHDCDADVDLSDYAGFTTVMSGPGVVVECAAFDADGDGDVDLRDAAALVSSFAP
ncbi:MAG TPA: hypothetical protein VM243_19490 [Phycisphaerae bacterium]|nr:hypothetical protein [Phycisphaerae bacterium]